MDSFSNLTIQAAFFAARFAMAANRQAVSAPLHAALGNCSEGTVCVRNDNPYCGSHTKASATVNSYNTMLKNRCGYGQTAATRSKNFQDKIDSHKWGRCA